MPAHTLSPGLACILTVGITVGVMVTVALPVMFTLQVVNIFVATTV